MLKRRTLLKSSGAALAAASWAGRPVHAQTGEPTFLIEIDLRDQFDWGHVMVAPGLAKDVNLKRGERGRAAALFYGMNELIETPSGIFLTPESKDLAPHLDTIAMVELCELSMGPVHGHEAGNGIRSPGRSNTQGGGRIAMWEGEPGRINAEGAYYSSTPTPASLHNHWQKKITPGLRNGVAIKGTDRHGGIYHFGAGLPGSELDRIQNVESLLKAFPAQTGDLSSLNILASKDESDAVMAYLKQSDLRHLTKRGLSENVRLDHESQLVGARGLVHTSTPKALNLALTQAEKDAWSVGCPNKYGRTTINAWEQAAYAFKLVESGIVRSVAYEVDIGDVHDERTKNQMRDQTGITVAPLLRLIENLKKAGIYDRTLVVVYTTDGGRAPAAGSSGDEGKNGAILAGGMIKGGYYGDIRTAGPDRDGQKYAYHMPDVATGAPVPTGTTGNDKRLPAAALWRTIMKALRVPDDIAGGFPDTMAAKPLVWLLRS